MANETRTEDLAKEYFEEKGFNDKNKFLIERQQSENTKIKELLKHASKKGNQNKGYPDFIITFKENTNLLISVECKANVEDHQSKEGNQPVKYAVDGTLWYANFLKNEYDVIAIAISGETKNELKIDSFYQKRNESTATEIMKWKNKIVSPEDYIRLFEKESKPLSSEELLRVATILNNNFHRFSIPETERCTLVGCILLALQNKNFTQNADGMKNKRLLDEIINRAKETLEDNKLNAYKVDAIIDEFEHTLRNNQYLMSDQIERKKGLSESQENTILKDTIRTLTEIVLPYTKVEAGFDILGVFYREFIRYAGTNAKTGLVLTPNHITAFFCELVELKVDDKVLDPCCGTGGFLVSAMKYMDQKAATQKEKENIHQNQLFGIEKRKDMFTHACSNMMMRGDGKSHIEFGSCFDQKLMDPLKKEAINISFLNPPYDVGPDGQLEFVENALNCLVKGGQCVAICQMSTAISSAKNVIAVKERILTKNTLKAVFSMPDDLFYPVGVVTCILVFEAGVPHDSSIKSFFGYFKDDGFEKRKNLGRIDLGTWNEKKEKMLKLYKNKESLAGLSVTKEVTAQDEWCAEAYMETDYSTLTEEDFIKVLKDYVAFEFLNGDK